MPYELVRERARDAGNDEVPRRVLKHRAMLHRNEVLDVLAVRLAPLPERHVADATARLDQLLASHLRIGLPRQLLVFQEAVDRPRVHRLPPNDVDLRLPDDLRLGRNSPFGLAVGGGTCRRLVHSEPPQPIVAYATPVRFPRMARFCGYRCQTSSGQCTKTRISDDPHPLILLPDRLAAYPLRFGEPPQNTSC